MTDWFRSWRGAPTDNKWLVIGRKAGVAPGMVSAVFWALLDHASEHHDRGTVADFDVEVYSAFSGFEDGDIAAIVSALEDKGVIVAGKLAGWERRQPKREDATSTDRVRAFREREMATKALPDERNAAKRSETQRNDREEEKREDKKRQDSPPLPPTAVPVKSSSVLVDLIRDELPKIAEDFTKISLLLSSTWLRNALAEAELECDGGAAELTRLDVVDAIDAAWEAIDRAMRVANGAHQINNPEAFARHTVVKAIGVRLNEVREQRRRPTATAPPRPPSAVKPQTAKPVPRPPRAGLVPPVAGAAARNGP